MAAKADTKTKVIASITIIAALAAAIILIMILATGGFMKPSQPGSDDSGLGNAPAHGSNDPGLGETPSDGSNDLAGDPSSSTDATRTFLAQVKSDENQDNPNGWAVFIDDYLFIASDDTENIARYGIDTSDGLDYYLFNETPQWLRYMVMPDSILIIMPDYPTDIYTTKEVGIWEFRFHLLAGPIWAEVTISETGDVVEIAQVYFP